MMINKLSLVLILGMTSVFAEVKVKPEAVPPAVVTKPAAVVEKPAIPEEKLTELEDAKIKNFRLQHQLNLDQKERLEAQYKALAESDQDLTAKAKEAFEAVGKAHGLNGYVFDAVKYELVPPAKTETPVKK